MKPSTILATILPALALASPATKARMASRQGLSVLEMIFGDSDNARAAFDQINDLITCLHDHNTFNADFSKADRGIFSLSDVEPTCCEKGKAAWNQAPDGKYGYAVFDEPCHGATVTGVSPYHMNMLRAMFAAVVDEP